MSGGSGSNAKSFTVAVEEDDAIDSKRAELGAAQNRLKSAIRNQSNAAENLETARSRIRDTDCAAETAALARENILQEASGSILVTANHSSEMILSLLQN